MKLHFDNGDQNVSGNDVPKGVVHTFMMLIIKADGRDLMGQFHKPVDENRMVVILQPDSYEKWLKVTPQQCMEFMRQYMVERLLSVAESPGQRPLLA